MITIPPCGDNTPRDLTAIGYDEPNQRRQVLRVFSDSHYNTAYRCGDASDTMQLFASIFDIDSLHTKAVVLDTPIV